MIKISLKPYSETFIKILGLFLLIIGLVGLYYGPLEIYCFYFFSKGGQFYYPGFQIGSLWFAYLVIQNAAYYIVAFLLIPIGIGTFKLQDWGWKLSLNLLYIWLILGISIISSFVISIPEFIKNINLSVISLILAVMALIGIIIPFIFIKLYRSEILKNVFKNRNKNFIDKIPQAVLLICSLNIIFILLLHASALLQYIFPFFGKIILHREGVHYISSAVFILAILTYGFWKRYFLAFWGLIIYYGLMLVSITMTFSKYSLTDLINLLNLPSYEQSQMIPVLSVFLNFNLTALLSSFLIIILCLIIYSKKYFQNMPEKSEDTLSFEN
jgi:hypothetical protein